jgi:spore germination protein YaaH
MRHSFIIATLILLFLAISLVLYLSLNTHTPPHNPLSNSLSFNNPNSSSAISVAGFLPYWTINSAAPLHQSVSDVMYFSLTLNESGNLITDQGIRNVQRAKNLLLPHQQFHLVFTVLNTSDIISILSNPTSSSRAIDNILDQAELYQVHGINLDFEPDTPVEPDTADQFVAFVSQLKSRYPNTIISVDVYPDPRYQSLWNLSELISHADYIITMTYDFHRQNSPNAGPISPIYGKTQKLWSSDVFTSLNQTLNTVPTNQLIMGIPFYGYEWQTTSQSHLSHTYPNSGRLATIGRTQNLIKSHQPLVQWDPISLSPWFTYQTNDEIRQIYYEDNLSLSLKLDLINQTNIAGAAIWALGYELDHKNIWEPFTIGNNGSKNMTITH